MLGMSFVCGWTGPTSKVKVKIKLVYAKDQGTEINVLVVGLL